MEQRKITIGHLYPDLLNLYGDRGNIACMMQRCIWRGIEAETKEFNLGDKIDFSELDIVLLGGGSDREQMIVCQKLQEIRPLSIGQAGRISGVSPSDIAVLLIWLSQHEQEA